MIADLLQAAAVANDPTKGPGSPGAGAEASQKKGFVAALAAMGIDPELLGKIRQAVGQGHQAKDAEAAGKAIAAELLEAGKEKQSSAESKKTADDLAAVLAAIFHAGGPAAGNSEGPCTDDSGAAAAALKEMPAAGTALDADTDKSAETEKAVCEPEKKPPEALKVADGPVISKQEPGKKASAEIVENGSAPNTEEKGRAAARELLSSRHGLSVEGRTTGPQTGTHGGGTMDDGNARGGSDGHQLPERGGSGGRHPGGGAQKADPVVRVGAQHQASAVFQGPEAFPAEAGKTEENLSSGEGGGAGGSVQETGAARSVAAAQGPPQSGGGESPQENIERLLRSAVFQVRNGKREARIELKPDHLGHLRMEVATDKQAVHVRITAELPAAKEMIEAHLHDLKAGLSNHGLQIDRFEVSLAGGANGGRQGASGGRETKKAPRGFAGGSIRGAAATTEPVAPLPSATKDRAVDCFA